MAIQDLKITVLIGNVPHPRMTSDLEPLFKAFALGEAGDMITFAKALSGVLEIGGKLKITGGTADDHAIVKSQLDTVNTTLSGQITALDGRCTSLEGRATSLEGRATSLEGRASSLEGRATSLEGRMTTAEGDISGLQTGFGDLTTLVGTFDGRISTLESDVAAIYANTPKEKRFTATSSQTIFNVDTFSFDADNAVNDIELWLDGRRQPISILGDFSDGAWRKNSTTQVETAEGILEGKDVIVWKQGTSSGSGGGGGTGIAVKDEGTTIEANCVSMNFAGAGVDVTRPSPGQTLVTIPGGGSTDLQNISVDIAPSVAGANKVGQLLKPWASVIVKDTDNTDVWEIRVESGVLRVVKLN